MSGTTGGATPTSESPFAVLAAKVVNTGLDLYSAKKLAQVDYEYKQPIAKTADVKDVKSAPTDRGELLQPGVASVNGLLSNPVVLLLGIGLTVALVIVLTKKIR
jgi:hypothetical protein